MGQKLTSNKEEEILRTLSVDQKEAYEFSKSGKNVLITGSGGFGKSYLARQMQDDRTVVAAPTGVAALNAKGVTLHKMFGLPIGLPTMRDFEKVPSKVYDMFGTNSPVNKVQIDEVGMVRSDTLHLIDKRLQKARGNKAPFGGIQIIGLGDFFQIEPILGFSEKNHFDFNTYKSVFAFDSPSWNLKEFTLTTPHRHANAKHVELLTSIRFKDENCEESLREIIKMAKPFDINEQVTMLCGFNKDAEDYNDRFYRVVKSPEKIYIAKNSGEEKYKPNEMPVADILRLKVGVKVIIKANSPDGSYVNGSVGVVKEMDDEFVVVTITEEGRSRDVFVEVNKWEKYDYAKTLNGLEKIVVGEFHQIPIKLGYAITIHASQGMTLEELCINMGRGAFSHGQLFVALSRIKNLENLRFSNPKAISVNDIIVRKEVLNWYNKLNKV